MKFDIGFLKAESLDTMVEKVKHLLHQLEPERWDTESLPTDTDISEVVEYLLNDHLGSLLEIQEEMYSNVDPRDDNTIIKGFQCSQKQNGVMQRYASFSKNESMSKAFEKRSHERDLKVSGSETSTQ